MKKFLLISLLLTFRVLIFAQKEEFAKWSLTMEGGLNKFDGDISQRAQDIIPVSSAQISYGTAIYYNLTPIWALNLDYYHLPLKASDQHVAFHSLLNTVDGNLSVNLTRLIFPHSQCLVNIHTSLGIGIATYTTYHRSMDPVDSPEQVFNGKALSVPVSLYAEWNCSKLLALGARLQYRTFNKDNIEGNTPRYTYKGVTNDYVGALTAFVRVKFPVPQKEHLRNISSNQHDQSSVLGNLKMHSDSIKLLKDELSGLKNKLGRDLIKLDSLQKSLSNKGADKGKDDVSDLQDKSKDTTQSTPDNSGKSLLKTSEQTKNLSLNNQPEARKTPSIYFDFDSYKLDNVALIIIQQIAEHMYSSPELQLEIRAYCDYPGSDNYNKLLSQKRAERVKYELVHKWGIAPERVITNGKGKIEDQKTIYRLNRRCDMYFNSKAI